MNASRDASLVDQATGNVDDLMTPRASPMLFCLGCQMAKRA